MVHTFEVTIEMDGDQYMLTMISDTWPKPLTKRFPSQASILGFLVTHAICVTKEEARALIHDASPATKNTVYTALSGKEILAITEQ